jgi:chemotaxis protein methyltransferase CheR
MPLDLADFEYVSRLARSNAAIVIDAGKEYLVESRLDPVARAEGFKSVGELVQKLKVVVGAHPLKAKVIDALTTNETFFFRDFQPFEALRTSVLPKLIEQRGNVKRLSIWSGACSTGQEPYSLAMLIREHFPQLRDWTIKILATDLSSTVLTHAREARYTQFEVNRGLPAPFLVKYFERRENYWCIKDQLKQMVEFKALNLAEPWPMLPPFDIVFLRNVMIYFDVDTKKSILRRMRTCTLPHSHLFLGAAETTVNLDPSWQPVTHGSTVAYRHVAALN